DYSAATVGQQGKVWGRPGEGLRPGVTGPRIPTSPPGRSGRLGADEAIDLVAGQGLDRVVGSFAGVAPPARQRFVDAKRSAFLLERGQDNLLVRRRNAELLDEMGSAPELPQAAVPARHPGVLAGPARFRGGQGQTETRLIDRKGHPGRFALDRAAPRGTMG